MERAISLTNNDAFYHHLLELEAEREEYFIETEIREVKDLPLRLLHHVGITKEEIAHLQHKALEESVWVHEYLEPLVTRFNEMVGRYVPARNYEFTVQAEDYDTIKIHARPKSD
jgi:hypothetical protein